MQKRKHESHQNESLDRVVTWEEPVCSIHGPVLETWEEPADARPTLIFVCLFAAARINNSILIWFADNGFILHFSQCNSLMEMLREN